MSYLRMMSLHVAISVPPNYLSNKSSSMYVWLVELIFSCSLNAPNVNDTFTSPSLFFSHRKAQAINFLPNEKNTILLPVFYPALTLLVSRTKNLFVPHLTKLKHHFINFSLDSSGMTLPCSQKMWSEKFFINSVACVQVTKSRTR